MNEVLSRDRMWRAVIQDGCIVAYKPNMIKQEEIMTPDPFNPAVLVMCPSCHWRGTGKDCCPKPSELAKCPHCGTPVRKVVPTVKGTSYELSQP